MSQLLTQRGFALAAAALQLSAQARTVKMGVPLPRAVRPGLQRRKPLTAK